MLEQIKKRMTKKTLYYMESIVYVCSIIVVVMANVYGPIQIRMIPLLFLLGMIGDIIFKRSVITTIFGAIVSLCIVYMSGVTNILENMITSGIFTLYIALGELCGSKMKIAYHAYSKKRKKKGPEFGVNVIASILLVILCAGFHNVTDSNLFIYQSCTNRLKNYLLQQYPEDTFEISYVTYQFSGEKCFLYQIRHLEDKKGYKFIVYVNPKLELYDGIKEGIEKKRRESLEKDFISLMEGKLEEIQMKIADESGIEEICLEKTVEHVDDESLLSFSKEIEEIIEKISNHPKFIQFETINLVFIDASNPMKNCISTLYLEGYRKNKEEGIQQGYQYIMKALKIEYMD